MKSKFITLSRKSVDQLILNTIKKSVKNKMIAHPVIYYDIEKKEFIITWIEK